MKLPSGIAELAHAAELSASDAAERLSDLAPEVASTVVRVAGDIALVVGDDGIIRSVAEGAVPLPAASHSWVGRAWVDTVDSAARQKVEALLQEAQHHGVSRRRELSHRSATGGDIPVSWAAVRLGERGPLLVVGRDLRAVSAIQQRFLDTQQALEREYWQRRQTESHYRQLFQVANDAVLVLDAQDGLVLDANPTTGLLLGVDCAWLMGQALRPCIALAQQPALDELLVTARATGHAAEVRLRVAASGAAIDMSATPFRAEDKACLLLRARRVEPSAQEPQAVLDFIGQTPDAVVVTDSAGRVLWANPAFVDLCEAPNETQLKGRALADAVGGDAQQWATLLARVRSRGIVGQASVTLRQPGAAALAVGVSAALLDDGDQEHIGFTLRPLPGVATGAAVGTGAELALDVAALESRLGQQSLQALLAEASRMAELHFIQTALRAHGGRLDGAALLLRVSPQALLARMSHLGLSPPPSAGSTGVSSLMN